MKKESKERDTIEHLIFQNVHCAVNPMPHSVFFWGVVPGVRLGVPWVLPNVLILIVLSPYCFWEDTSNMMTQENPNHLHVFVFGKLKSNEHWVCQSDNRSNKLSLLSLKLRTFFCFASVEFHKGSGSYSLVRTRPCSSTCSLGQVCRPPPEVL